MNKLFINIFLFMCLTNTVVFAGKLADSSFINILEHFQINDPSQFDWTTNIQSIIDGFNEEKGGTIFFPNGVYKISSNIIIRKNNIKLIGNNNSIIEVTSSSVEHIFEVDQKHHIQIKNLIFTVQASAIATFQFALRVERSKSINVENCVTNNCGLFQSYEPAGSTYATISVPHDLSSDIRIINNKISGVLSQDHYGIQVSYSYACNITGNVIKNFEHGIYWNGGNADPYADGRIDYTRKAYDITISNNTIDSISGGGIWGSMGERITVTGNTVSNCGDVGIDFEGCYFSTATGNTVRNAKNGGLTVYHISKGIVFSGNSVYANHPRAMCALNGQRGDDSLPLQKYSQDVSIIGNHFEILEPGFYSSIRTFSGNCWYGGQSLIISENTFRNVNIDFLNDEVLDDGSRVSFRTFDNVKISNNYFIFSANYSNDKFNAINLYIFDNRKLDISGNTILSTITQQYGGGIHIYMWGNTPEAYVQNNRVQGFPEDIHAHTDGGHGTYVITNNTLGAGNVFRDDVGGAVTSFYFNGNLKSGSQQFINSNIYPTVTASSQFITNSTPEDNFSFTINNKQSTIHHYGLSSMTFNHSNLGVALSGYEGLGFFTNGQAQLSIDPAGFIRIRNLPACNYEGAPSGCLCRDGDVVKIKP